MLNIMCYVYAAKIEFICNAKMHTIAVLLRPHSWQGLACTSVVYMNWRVLAWVGHLRLPSTQRVRFGRRPSSKWEMMSDRFVQSLL